MIFKDSTGPDSFDLDKKVTPRGIDDGSIDKPTDGSDGIPRITPGYPADGGATEKGGLKEPPIQTLTDTPKKENDSKRIIFTVLILIGLYIIAKKFIFTS